MSRVRTAVLGVVVWCGVVALVSTLVWVVISRAGQGVVPETTPQADVTGSLPVPPGDRLRSARPAPGATLSPRPSAPSSGPTTPVLPPTSGSSPATLPQRRSWNGGAGHMVVECRGASASLVSAFPNAGYRYTILARGPSLVQVRFARIGEDRGVTVSARCVAGVPHFAVASGGEPVDN